MKQEFIDILQKLIAEQGKETLLDASKCKALLADYTRGEYKKESRLLLQALDAGVQKKIDTTKELATCKKKQIRLLHEDYGLDEKLAADIVDTLALVLRGDNAGSEAQAAFERGIKHFFENKDYDKAIEEFTEAIRIDPNYDLAYVSRGQSYSNKGQNDQAISDYTESIRLNPDDALAYYSRGATYGKKGQYDKAISDCSKAIKLDPNGSAAFAIRGLAYTEKCQFDEAIKDLNEAIRLAPNDALAYYSRGDAYWKKGQYDQTISDFTEAVKLNPNVKSYILNHPFMQLMQEQERIDQERRASQYEKDREEHERREAEERESRRIEAEKEERRKKKARRNRILLGTVIGVGILFWIIAGKILLVLSLLG